MKWELSKKFKNKEQKIIDAYVGNFLIVFDETIKEDPKANTPKKLAVALQNYLYRDVLLPIVTKGEKSSYEDYLYTKLFKLHKSERFYPLVMSAEFKGMNIYWHDNSLIAIEDPETKNYVFTRLT